MKKLSISALVLALMLSMALPAAAAETGSRSYTLTFAGDCTFGCSPATYYAQMGFVKTVGKDYGYPFRNVLPWFQQDDLTIVNLEGPLTEVGGLVKKEYNFRGPLDFVNILTQNSVEAVTIANNHAFDYSQAGYDSTRKVLEEAGVPYVERDSGTIVELEGGLTVGLYGMVYYRYPTAKELKAGFDKLRSEGADLIIFLPHWGVEYIYEPTPLQIQTGHDAIDAGADIVCGSHPHVLQPIEHYGDGIIYYSMGNFSFGGNSDPRDYDTALIQQELTLGSDGTVTLGKTICIPACVSSTTGWNNYQPTPYEEGSEGYARVLEKLKFSPES